MKSFFRILSLLFIWTQAINAREIIFIGYNQHKSKAETIKRIIQQEIHIPDSLITIQQTTTPCLSNQDSIMHICLDKDGKMQFPVVRKDIIRRALLTFRNSP